jgi:predicted MPP superfamily phosphohydrolase
LFFLIILLIWGAMHAYVLSRLLSIPFVIHLFPSRFLIPIILFLGASYILARVMEHFNLNGVSHVLEYVGASWVGIFFVIFVAFVAADILTGFGLLLPALAIKFRTGALIVAAVLIAIAYVQACRTPVVTEYEVKMRGLPSEADGTVLVAASDTHLGSMLGKRWATARATQIDGLKPDVLVLVGDIFEGEKETHEGWAPVMRQFHAPLGVYVVTGNHEFYAGSGPIIDLFRKSGFRVLRDENVEIRPGLVLAGVDDITFRKNGKQDQPAAIEQALANRPVGATVFLSHTPVLPERAAKLGAGLMISGHTHEGQIWPFKYLVRMAFKLLNGRYDVNGMTAIVGRGTGTWGPRMRLWKRSEILRITLRAA